jgi:Zn-finger nucleic acid-binding protein
MLKTKYSIEIESPIGDSCEAETTLRMPCRRCEKGQIKKLISTTPYGSDYEIEECPICAGTGWLDAVITVKFEPAKYEIRQSKIDRNDILDYLNKTKESFPFITEH